jgi:response regulator RpfG family c-di-GMP phosphodiesterase
MNDDFLFVDEADEPDEDHAELPTGSWKVLIVDDEPEVHAVTKLALSDFLFNGKSLEFVSAYSGEEAKQAFNIHTDIAVVLLDVVMEEDDSGLKVAEYIRDELHNHFCRIILRTGQPGQAPEKDVIINYDINDYKSKTELTSQKLFTVVISALRSYNDIIVIEENRAGLQKIVEASADLFCAKSLEIFIQGIVQQLSSILGCSQDAAYLTSAVATPQPVYLADSDQLYVFAGNGEYANHEGKPIEDVVDEVKMSSCRKALKERSIVYADDHLVAFCDSKARRSSLLYLSGLPRKLTKVDKNLVEIFAQNVQIAFDNVLSTRDMEDTQQEIIERLGVAMEHNTNTTQQLRRIRDICEFIGTKLGMEETDIALLVRAVPLHDIGSAKVPSAILQKPEELEYLERESIKRHTTFGYNILKDSKRPIIQLAATLAHQHHERWDGLGYPNGMKGEEIALEARITAIADVFDALYNQRPHKAAWPVEKVVKMIESQSGKHFDPKIAQILLDNLDQIQAIQQRHTGT